MHITCHIPATTKWRRSSYSNAAGGDCIEVADGVPGIVPVRDSKCHNGPTLLIAAASWAAFIDDTKSASGGSR